MEHHELEVRRTARYVTLGPPEAREVWLALHGYGELAADFLERLRVLDDGRRSLVAPEGLSRFYREGGAGPVGASWMTREARTSEMADYLEYLDTLAAHVVGGGTALTVLGFSQGAATAARWAVATRFAPRRLVLWGGALPPDLDLEACAPRLRSMELVIVVGSRDRWIGPDERAAHEERLQRSGVPFRSVSFEGGHRLDEGTLVGLAHDAGSS